MGYPANYGPRACVVCGARLDVRSMTAIRGTGRGRRYACPKCRRFCERLGKAHRAGRRVR